MSQPKPPEPTFHVPDLEIEPAPSKRAAPQPGPAASQRGPSRGRELDLEAGPGVSLSHGSQQGSAPFELEMSGGSFGSLDSFGADGLELIQTGSKVELAGAVTRAAAQARIETTSWPTGRSPSADQLPIDPAEVALVADYGSTPGSALGAPGYAYRIYARRGPLRRALAEHAAALRTLEVERDTALATLATELRSALEASEGFRRLLEPVREIERLAGDRNTALSQADAGYREQMAGFDTELVRLQTALGTATSIASAARARADASDNELRRAEAKLKRVQIEIRGTLDVARQAVGPTGGDMPPAQAAQLAEQQTRLQALEPEVAGVRASHGSVMAALHAAQGEQRALEGQLGQLTRQKAAASGALEKQLSARAAGVTEAEEQRRQALAEVSRGVLAARGSLGVPEPTLSTLRDLDKRVVTAAVRLETHLRALDSYDRERARQGVLLVLGALGMVVLAIVLKAVL